MKNVKLIFFALVSVLIVLPLNTFAKEAYLINNNGIMISEEEYNNFIKIRPYEYLMTMDEDDYNKLKGLDYSNIKTTTKYIQTVYNRRYNAITEKEITKEEYESNIMPILDDDSTYIETTNKSLSLTLAGGSKWNYVVLTAAWKGTPVVRSFDVIGIRGDGVDFRNGSQTGEQIYSENGKYTKIDYDWNGTNIKRFDNGFGISMNVVNNDNLDSLVMTVDCDVTPTDTFSDIFGAYEHAVTNVSLEESHNYTLEASGLGEVFNFPLKVRQKYDGMTGVHLFYRQ